MRDYRLKFYDPPDASSGGGEAAPAAPAAPAPAPGPTPAELQARLDAIAEQNRQLSEANERLQQHLLYSMARTPQAPQAPSAPVDAPPNRDEDPEGYINWAVKQRVDASLAANLRPVVERVAADRSILLSTAEESAKAAVRSRYPDLWATHEVAVTKYLSAFPPEQRTSAANVEEALKRVVGEAAITRHIEESRSSAAAGLGGGRASTPPTEHPVAPTIDPSFKAAAASLGMPDTMFAALQGKNVSIDDYLAAKAAATGAKR